jgi:DNA-binding XRE family transcriptional regulator
MGLREYLAITGETQEAFAKKVGVSRVTINSYLNKGVMPYLKHCLINKARFTNKKVVISTQSISRTTKSGSEGRMFESCLPDH